MSEIRATTISDLAGTGPATLTGQSAAKIWVNFNGTGTIAARGSFNVASLTDNGTGLYSVNLSSAMTNANGPVCSSDYQAAQGNLVTFYNTASVVSCQSYNDSSALADYQYVQLVGMGDLA